MAIHYSILARITLRTEEPRGLQSTVDKSRTQLSTTILWYEGNKVPGTLQMETVSRTATPLQPLHRGTFWVN